MKELLLSLMVWMGANTHYKDPVALPEVKVVAQAELRAIMGTGYEGNPILGVYTPHIGTIYLDNGIDIKTDDGKSTVLHELVHHYQARTGTRHSNPCLFEAEAYSVEDKWRRQNKLPETTHNPTFIYWMGKCVLSMERVK